MKKVILSITLLFALFSVSAQNANYEKAMTDLVAQIQAVSYEESFQPLANKMERIANAESKQWLPQYWMAYCYTQESFKKQEPAERDQLLDIADGYMTKTEALGGNENSEIEVLKAQLATGRLSIDPMSRYQEYGGKYQKAINNAKKFNSENPRIYYLMGTNAFFTPENFGGGKTIAKPLFEKALEKFNNFELKSAFYPNWGTYETEYFLSQY
jgi:hypothetical protein